MSSQMVAVGNFQITRSQLMQMRRDMERRGRHVLSVAPPARPVFANDTDIMDAAQELAWLKTFAGMTDGAEYLNAMGRPSAW